MNKSVASAIVGVIAGIIVLLVVFLPSGRDDRPRRPDSDPNEGSTAARPEEVLLGEVPGEPKEFLLWAATAPSAPINAAAIEAIGRLEGPWTNEFLAGALAKDEDGDYEDEERAGAALVALARRGAPDLLPHLEHLIEKSDEDWDVDSLIATALGEIAGPESLRVLLGLVTREDPDEDVLMVAIPALAKHEGDDAKDAIKSLLDHDDEDVQATAAATLLRLGDADAERLMRAFLEDPDSSDWDEDILAGALGIEGSTAALPALGILATSEFWDTRQLALRSLGATRLPEAQQALTKALEDEDEEVRTTAAAALLREFGDAAGAEILVAAVEKSRDWEAIVEAVRALSTLNREEDRPRFEAAFGRKAAKVEWLLVKLWAAHALLTTAK